MSLSKTAEFNIAVIGNMDVWVPASGGSEEVFTVNGTRLQYCYNPFQKRHAYYNVDTDMILHDKEAEYILSK